MKTYLVLLICMFITSIGFSQTLEELQTMKADKEASIASLSGELADIDGKIASMPGWKKGSFGTIGFNLSNFNNWVTKANPNSSATNILGSFNAFANQLEDKFFWRNSLNLAVGWQKLIIDNTVDNVNSNFEQTTDALVISSLYGRKLNDIVAASGLGEIRTTVLNNAFNPGYLDLGVGVTLTPSPPLVIVIHPLNYNFVFAKDDVAYQSSLGAKLVADYSNEIYPGVNFRSNVSSFLSYKDFDNLSNFTWTNSLGFTAFKGIGIGIEYAVRANKQETNAAGSDKVNQNYWVIGLTYSL